MIIRTPNRDRFLIVSKVGIEDDRLSWKARGLLVYLLSKPDNWEVMQAHLIKQAPDGTASVRAGLNELKEAGYITSAKSKNDAGRFDGWDSFVYEEPVTEMQFQHVGGPTDGKTDVRKSHTNEELLSMKNEEMKNEDNESTLEAKELCSILQTHIVGNGFKPFTEGKSSLSAMDRLLRIDQRTPEQVRYIINWCQRDEFWLGNIRSPQKLRDKFDTLIAQATRANRGAIKFLQNHLDERESVWS